MTNDSCSRSCKPVHYFCDLMVGMIFRVPDSFRVIQLYRVVKRKINDGGVDAVAVDGSEQVTFYRDPMHPVDIFYE